MGKLGMLLADRHRLGIVVPCVNHNGTGFGFLGSFKRLIDHFLIDIGIVDGQVEEVELAVGHQAGCSVGCPKGCFNCDGSRTAEGIEQHRYPFSFFE